ncbi:unnamed protein product [Parnassius mnemosyne]|uniref:PHD-type domain-containing protein n=1 Tax=Parnassius mnemosyne TaxID=213953 RepID=A0AAV1L5D2_9NEOP
MDCFKCKKNIAERDVIKCTGCNMYMHYKCADLSETEFKKILPMNKIKWKCPPCKNKRLAGTLGGTVSPKFKDCTTTSILNVDTDALTEYMDAKLDSLRQQWQEDLNSAIQKVSKTFAQDINRLEKRVDSWEERIKELEQNFTASHSPDVTPMQENNELRADLENLRAKFDDLDQASRSCNVELQNIPEKKAENLIHLSIEVGKLIGVDIKASDIRSVHRVSPKVPNDRPKNIVLQLTTRRLRDDMIAAARSRRTLTTTQLFGSANSAAATAQNTRFYINEHLTLKNKILFSNARQLAKSKGCILKNSCILLRKNDDSRVIHIRCTDDLSKI